MEGFVKRPGNSGRAEYALGSHYLAGVLWVPYTLKREARCGVFQH